MPDRLTFVYPAFDCMLNHGDACTQGHPVCDPTKPGTNYGRGEVRIRHVLRFPDVATQLVWSPGVHLPETNRVLGHDDLWCRPKGWDLGWHAPRALDDSEDYAGEPVAWPRYGTDLPCDLFDTGGCWYDGSGLNAEPVLDRLIREGLDAVWEELEKYAAYLRLEAGTDV